METKGKKSLAGIGAVAITALLAAPAFAEKQAITDSELDLISAAGQPVAVNNFGGSLSEVILDGETTVVGGLEDEAQESLRALVLNNVVGENQVANGVNVTGGGTSNPQDNTITQSWGAVTDIGVETVDGAPAANCGFAFIGICKPEKGTPDRAVLLSKYGDQVVENFAIGSEEGPGQAQTLYVPFSAFVQEIGGNAQTNLAALVVNNVVGLNQVANGVNIASGNLTVDTPIAFISTGQTAAGQSNTINQFRGAPFGWNDRQFIQ